MAAEMDRMVWEAAVFERTFSKLIRAAERIERAIDESVNPRETALMALGIAAGLGSVFAFQHRREIGEGFSLGVEKAVERFWSVDPHDLPDF